MEWVLPYGSGARHASVLATGLDEAGLARMSATGSIRVSVVGEGAAAMSVLSGAGVHSHVAVTMVRDAPAWRGIRQNPPVLEFGGALPPDRSSARWRE